MLRQHDMQGLAEGARYNIAYTRTTSRNANHMIEWPTRAMNLCDQVFDAAMVVGPTDEEFRHP